MTIANPLILETSVVVPANAAVQAATAPMQSPFRGGMFIDEVRFAVLATFQFPLAIYAKLELGRDPLTNGFISPVAFCKQLNVGLGPTKHVYTWRFPRPLYVPNTELLVPTILNSPLSGSTTLTVDISYVCRALLRGDSPKVIHMPWAAAFHGVIYNTSTSSSFTEESMESDLVNPFNVPLNLQRFVSARPVAQTFDQRDLYTRDVLVRLSDSMGRHAVKDATPIGHLCNMADGGYWNVNSVMAPKSFFISRWDVTTGQTGQAVADRNILGIVGHREVRIQ